MSNQATPRTGVWFQGGLKIKAATELAVRAEEAGVDSIWVAEGPVTRDAFITLSALALATNRVDLATGVVNPFTRHPAQLAATFATLDELSQGRAICGIGIGARDGLIPLGADVSKPLTAAREMVSIIRSLLARDEVILDGAVFKMDHVRLGLRPYRESMPIYLAATGPKMCALAGESADGIYLLYGTQEYVKSSLNLAHAARTVTEPLRVASPILMAVGNNDDDAVNGVKIGIGLMLTEPNGEAMLEANGVDPALAQPIRDGLANGGVKALIEVVDNSIIDRLTIVGTHAQCVERLQEAVSWGISEPQILLTGDDPSALLGVLDDLKSSF
ncbi:MAG: LLM class flavin-dependent oxidoreductase [Actinobacteria bacterium]|nr:LLM class flavin-dependent oxidoreductase [Actinomycetota bacterium]